MQTLDQVNFIYNNGLQDYTQIIMSSDAPKQLLPLQMADLLTKMQTNGFINAEVNS